MLLKIFLELFSFESLTFKQRYFSLGDHLMKISSILVEQSDAKFFKFKFNAEILHSISFHYLSILEHKASET